MIYSFYQVNGLDKVFVTANKSEIDINDKVFNIFI